VTVWETLVGFFILITDCLTDHRKTRQRHLGPALS
jgi:hypothetical protein